MMENVMPADGLTKRENSTVTMMIQQRLPYAVRPNWIWIIPVLIWGFFISQMTFNLI